MHFRWGSCCTACHYSKQPVITSCFGNRCWPDKLDIVCGTTTAFTVTELLWLQMFPHSYAIASKQNSRYSNNLVLQLHMHAGNIAQSQCSSSPGYTIVVSVADFLQPVAVQQM